jgi:hypothetical protein
VWDKYIAPVAGTFASYINNRILLKIETEENCLNEHCPSVLYYKEMKAPAEASALQ